MHEVATDEAGAVLEPPFDTTIARHVWDSKYRHRRGTEVLDRTIGDTWRRVARSLAAVEARDREAWEQRFHDALAGFRFLPGGRILAGAGTAQRVTLFNCFVMGVIEDSMPGIFTALEEGALTMQQGGGVGYDFSTLRPRGARARATGTIASGPVSFLRVWDSMAETVLSTGARRAAMMGTLRCDHPDVEELADAKRAPGALSCFNLSVQVTDDFLAAVRADRDWPLVFPVAGSPDDDPEPAAPLGIVERRWTGSAGPVACRVVKVVRARELWRRIVRAAYDTAEPGVLFVDRINRANNLWYREHLTTTNPCGEVPLPPYGACDLGSLELSRFVRAPFSREARLDLDALGAAATVAVRLLDDVIDASLFPLPAQREQAIGTRRIGLGITGLADALAMLDLPYDSDEARREAAGAMRTICHAAYRASIENAREKGPFPYFEREPFLAGELVATLPPDIRDGIAAHGLRNSHLTAIAPAGTISLLAGNVSSGLEPIFDFELRRRVRLRDGSWQDYELVDAAVRRWRASHRTLPLPSAFVRAEDVDPLAHLAMQAALQPYVDSAISKTIQVPAALDFTAFESIYSRAHELGLKGCTTYRPTELRGAVLRGAVLEPAEATAGPHCCTARLAVEREAD